MTDFKGFKGAAKKLDDIDLPREGAAIKVGEDVLHAFMDTESRGKGFDPQGRPIILFEPHVFYRCLPESKRAEAVRQGLAYPTWKAGKYGPESAQYGKLEKAIKIDEAAALKACSWGMFQVLGENHKMIGYPTVQAMVLDMMADEENHLRAAIKFTVAAHIDDDLRLIDKILKTRNVTAAECAPTVRVYNGPGYAKNGYHTKFAASANRWRKIKDTPWSPGEKSPIAFPGEALEMEPAVDIYDGKFHAELLAVQQQLDRKGWPEVGTLDGKWKDGGKTAGAILSFKTYVGLPTDSPRLTDEFLSKLSVFPDGGREIAAARRDATVDTLRAKGAADVKAIDLQQYLNKGLLGLGAAGTVAGAVDKLGEYSELAQKVAAMIDPLKTLVIDNIGLILLGGGGFGVWQAAKLLAIRLQKHQTAQDVSE